MAGAVESTVSTIAGYESRTTGRWLNPLRYIAFLFDRCDPQVGSALVRALFGVEAAGVVENERVARAMRVASKHSNNPAMRYLVDAIEVLGEQIDRGEVPSP